MPKPQRGSTVREGFFAKGAFRCDPAEDVYVCPAGERLWPKYESKSRELTRIDYSNRSACLACALRPRCTNSLRRVSRLENEAGLDRMAARLRAEFSLTSLAYNVRRAINILGLHAMLAAVGG